MAGKRYIDNLSATVTITNPATGKDVSEDYDTVKLIEKVLKNDKRFGAGGEAIEARIALRESIERFREDGGLQLEVPESVWQMLSDAAWKPVIIQGGRESVGLAPEFYEQVFDLVVAIRSAKTKPSKADAGEGDGGKAAPKKKRSTRKKRG